MIEVGFRWRMRESEVAALVLGGVSVGWGCPSAPWEAEDPELHPRLSPPRANSSASTLTLPDTSWVPTSRPVSFMTWRVPEGQGWRLKRGLLGSPLVGNRHPHTQGTWLPATQSLCLSFPLCRRKITEPWEGIDAAYLRRGKCVGSFRCFYEVSTASLWVVGRGSLGPPPVSVIH